MEKQGLQILTRSLLWAIRPGVDIISLLSSPQADASIAKPSIQGRGQNKIAVIPIRGILTKDGPSWYGTNYDTITTAAEKAGSDPDVKRVVLAVDSPGGEVTGLPETAAVLAQLAKTKPLSAIVEGTSASAAYWLTSQANDITLTPSGEVGSVGVRMMHVDVSKAMESMGYSITELHSGDYKTEWSPYKPLSLEAIADMQPRLEATHADFIAAVAQGRRGRVTPEMAKRRMGEGRMFPAVSALAGGLVDKIQSANDFYRSVTPAQPEVPPIGLNRARVALERQRFS